MTKLRKKLQISHFYVIRALRYRSNQQGAFASHDYINETMTSLPSLFCQQIHAEGVYYFRCS